MTNIILSGGSGTRLWPISRTLMPKQFVRLFSDRSLFMMSYERNSPLCERTLVVSNEQQYFLALDQLEALGARGVKFLLEPVGRNTAPAIALACLSLKAEEIVFVTPSDHLIRNEVAYKNSVLRAHELAKQGFLVTFGIKPTEANTGYGYIEASGEDVLKFHEKPELAAAQSYIAAGNFYWNSGMFMFKADVFLSELKAHSPEIYEACVRAHENSNAENPIRIKLGDMQEIPADSIDYAVMEHTSLAKVVPADIGWSDLGSFDSLDAELPKDANGNTAGEQNITLNSKNNLIIGSGRTIAAVDVEDLAIVDTKDALLVCKKGSTQKVKQVVERLKDSDLARVHVTTHRPWGSYTVLEDERGYKIKRIVVKPGKRLSLQKHYHRNEHWIVVSGTATVTVGERNFLLRENESTFIRMGEVHRLANEGKIPVVLIEAQVGSYTGEDDIVRLQDDFNRS
ncbi:mannose-1-phosphate guanylyltransferase/mannose-6-phosphate isomerase [uncultured Campylobacter sp.]|uniref:mannose-1-phosphate guanylyltransferase/mannose-6-phosphate isomerase n=1 Tax=uncultured Campylobacter sp. TaxID=218934 RepID=UPI0026098720|nr:mannose-1-phosphate guanylyltransferase/mannose-6-phosphate isomerase [uncultured Campylobacter sp.]